MVVGIDEQMQMRSQLSMAVVVVAFDRRVLDRTVHSLDLPVGPRVVHLGQTVLDAMLVADTIEDVLTVVDIPLA